MLTKETVKGMRKAELITQVIADQNRLVYLKDKVDRLSEENKEFKAGLEELQQKHAEQIAELAMKYGGRIEIPMHGTLEDYNIQVTMVKKEERA